MSKIEQLRVLFPQFDADILGSVLTTTKGEVDDAIDMLLSMDGSVQPSTPNVTNDQVAVEPLSPSRRALARKRQRQRQLRLTHTSTRKRSIDKKVKWVRFDPFVTVKEPLKDDNSYRYRLLADVPEEEGVADSWEDIAEKETEESTQEQEPIDASWLALPEEEKPDNDILELSSSNLVEDATCENLAEDTIPWDDSLIFEVTEIVLPEQSEPEQSDEEVEAKPVCLLAVKIYFSVYDIRRIPLDRNDPSAFATLAASVSRILQASSSDAKMKPFAPKYVDDENEYVTVCSQEEFDECLRVHETCIWPNDRRTMPLLKLYL